MNIVYSASDLYSTLAGISMTSLLMNNTDVPDIRVIILDNNIGKENREKLTKTAERFGREIIFVPLKECLGKLSLDMKRWNVSTFGRLFEASSLPDFDKVLHIDCDTVVDGSLKELWNTDIENKVLAASPDCIGDAYKTSIGIKPDGLYIQAGVILLNLKRIRELELEKKFLNYLETYGESLAFVDQEIINACVPEEEKCEIPLRYNSYSLLHLLSYEQVKKFKRVSHMVSEENYDDAVANGVIYHFTWSALEGTRPWINGDGHPKKDLFMYYKAQSEWADNEMWEDTRKTSKKLMTDVANMLPKGLLTTVAGYIHGVMLPKRNAKKRKATFRKV